MKRDGPDSDGNEAIADALERLCEEIAVVREVLDGILDELQSANRNRGDELPDIRLVLDEILHELRRANRENHNSSPLVPRVTSMPLDPTASDWTERLNRYSPADLPGEAPASPIAGQGHLF